MLYVSDVYKTKPEKFNSELQSVVYNTLEKLFISYERVDTDEAITMEDCIEIDKKLDVKTVKTLFLCNQQKTKFYLFITSANKRFDCKKFSKELNISRVSFASEKLINNMIGAKIGSVTIFGAILDKDNKIQVVFDKDVLKEEYYGCTDGTTTGYMKIKLDDVLNKILPYSNHKEEVIEM